MLHIKFFETNAESIQLQNLEAADKIMFIDLLGGEGKMFASIPRDVYSLVKSEIPLIHRDINMIKLLGLVHGMLLNDYADQEIYIIVENCNNKTFNPATISSLCGIPSYGEKFDVTTEFEFSKHLRVNYDRKEWYGGREEMVSEYLDTACLDTPTGVYARDLAIKEHIGTKKPLKQQDDSAPTDIWAKARAKYKENEQLKPKKKKVEIETQEIKKAPPKKGRNFDVIKSKPASQENLAQLAEKFNSH